MRVRQVVRKLRVRSLGVVRVCYSFVIARDNEVM